MIVCVIGSFSSFTYIIISLVTTIDYRSLFKDVYACIRNENLCLRILLDMLDLWEIRYALLHSHGV